MFKPKNWLSSEVMVAAGIVLLFVVIILFNTVGKKMFPEKDEDIHSDSYYEGYDEGYDDGVNYAIDELESSVDYLPSFGFLEDIISSYYEYPELEDMLGYSQKELEEKFEEYEYATSDFYSTIKWLNEHY